MKQRVMEGDTPYLPQEIITNILKRLPVRSIIRFQRVCKYWKNLIKTPSFIADHLHHSTHQNPLLIVKCFGQSDPSLLWCPDREIQVHQVLNAPLMDFMIIDSHNGLLFVQSTNCGRYCSLLLWNPAIREVHHVPKSVNFSRYEDLYVGFGFSPIVDDWKIVRIFIRLDDKVIKVEVYSLSTGSWKKVEFGNLKGVILHSNGVTINGAIFWYGEKLDGPHLIVSFDIAMEVFTLIPIPRAAQLYGTILTVYENKLAMFSYENKLAMFSDTETEDLESSRIHLWVMEEGTGPSGGRRSWTRKYTCSLGPHMVRPMTIWRNEIVCPTMLVKPRLLGQTKSEANDDEPDTVLVNLSTDEFQMFSTHRCGRRDHFQQIFNYAESLLSVGNMHIEDP